MRRWSPDSSIGVIFSSDLTDGVFDGTWALFRDRLTWLRESLYEIKKETLTLSWLKEEARFMLLIKKSLDLKLDKAKVY